MDRTDFTDETNRTMNHAKLTSGELTTEAVAPSRRTRSFRQLVSVCREANSRWSTAAVATVPNATVPDATVPDATVPDATVPDATVPDATVAGAIAAVAIAAACLLSSHAAVADTVEISGGGHVASEAVVRKSPEGERAYVAARLDDDLWVKLPESRVSRVVSSRDLAEYRRRVEIAGDDPALHFELARWCKLQTSLPLSDQYRYHLRRVIELDPDHSKARAVLGYVRHEGEWQKFADVKRAEGMISVSGRWVVPEAETLRRQAEETEVASKRWGKEVIRLRKMAERGNQDGWTALQEIEDPLASWAVARELKDSRDNQSQRRQLRRLWVQLLGRFKTAVSVEALTLAVLEEPDSVIRDLAIEQLKEYGESSAIATFVPMLASNKEGTVTAAAAALVEFDPQPRLAMRLVDALVTEHKRVIQPGPGTQVGFSNLGGGGMTTGGKAKVVKRAQKNPDVRSLLKAIEPGVDYGYDQDRWRRYFADKWSVFSGDLRRDP